MDDVVATTVPEQMPEHPDPEHHAAAAFAAGPAVVELPSAGRRPSRRRPGARVHRRDPTDAGSDRSPRDHRRPDARRACGTNVPRRRRCAETGSHRRDRRASGRQRRISSLGSQLPQRDLCARSRSLYRRGTGDPMSTVEREAAQHGAPPGDAFRARWSRSSSPASTRPRRSSNACAAALEVLATQRHRGRGHRRRQRLRRRQRPRSPRPPARSSSTSPSADTAARIWRASPPPAAATS